MGLSSSKQTTKTDQTVKPVAPQYLTDQAQAYTGALSQALARDPASRVLPANEAQLKAFEAANNLGGWAGAADAAAANATKAGKAPAASASNQTAQAYTYDPTTYTAEQAQSYSLLDNLEAYQNPYLQQVVDATLADFDAQAGQTRAQLMAQGARNKALGGSRFGIAQALTESELARARATQDATLRAQGFDTAARLSGEDATRRQQAEMFNVGARNDALRFGADSTNQASQFNAQSRTGVSQFNAGEANTTSRANAQLAEAAKQRALEASRVEAQIAAAKAEQARADLALQAQLAEQQRQIEMQQQNADLMALQAIGQAQALTPYEVLVGQNVTGTNVTKSNPGLLGIVNAGVGIGSLFA